MVTRRDRVGRLTGMMGTSCTVAYCWYPPFVTVLRRRPTRRCDYDAAVEARESEVFDVVGSDDLVGFDDAAASPRVESLVLESLVLESLVLESLVLESLVVESPVVESPLVESPDLESPVVDVDDDLPRLSVL